MRRYSGSAQSLMRHRLRQQVLETLGGRCAFCGTTDVRVLQLDHRANNGAAERKLFDQRTIYRKAIQNPHQYQLLCANCTFLKRAHEQVRPMNLFAVYVASSFLNKSEAINISQVLQASGYRVTSRWFTHNATTSWNILQNEALEDVADVRGADALILVWPGRFGSSSEVGMALALHKPVIIIGQPPDQTNVYFYHPDVHIVTTIVEAIALLGRLLLI